MTKALRMKNVFELTFSKARDFFGDDAAPMLIKLKVTNGQVTWDHEKVRDAQLEQVREMVDAGMRTKDIAKELELTPGRVSQLMKKLRKHHSVVPFPKPRSNQDECESEKNA